MRDSGIAALAETILSGERVPARLLAQRRGERRLTDLGHVARAAARCRRRSSWGSRHSPAGCASGLRPPRARARPDERTRRLESDAAAVQVLTFHRSKGLEFPIVYCPFLWDPGRLAEEGEPVYFHDADAHASPARSTSVLRATSTSAHLASTTVEERGEDLRLAYVALTRARHQAVIWWAGAWQREGLAARQAAVRTGRRGQCRLAGRQAPA